MNLRVYSDYFCTRDVYRKGGVINGEEMFSTNIIVRALNASMRYMSNKKVPLGKNTNCSKTYLLIIR